MTLGSLSGCCRGLGGRWDVRRERAERGWGGDAPLEIMVCVFRVSVTDVKWTGGRAVRLGGSRCRGEMRCGRTKNFSVLVRGQLLVYYAKSVVEPYTSGQSRLNGPRKTSTYNV